MQLPAYIQHVANDLIQAGHPESEAVHMAVGIVEKWAKGGGNVTADTQAKAAAAVAEWEKLRGQAKTTAKRATMSAVTADADTTEATRGGPGEILRFYPLEDIHILSRAEGDGSGTLVEAYATVFDQPAEIRDHQGHYLETIDRGAFDDVLGRIRRSRGGLPGAVKVLYNHGMTAQNTPAPEFQLPLGVPVDVIPEKRGLLTRTRYDAGDPFTDRILSKIRSGAITAQSFVGGIIRSDPSLAGPGDRYRKRGGALTTVRRMTLGLREYGPVLWPAYSGAEILGVRMQLPGDDLEETRTAPDTPQDDEYDSADRGASRRRRPRRGAHVPVPPARAVRAAVPGTPGEEGANPRWRH